jgi:DNA polymerase V
MIFTKKGFLGTTVLEQLYVLSCLTAQTFNTRELRTINGQITNIRDKVSIGDELFTKAKELKLLNKKKKLIETKYKKLRDECLKRTQALEQTLTWKSFVVFYSIANYIFRGYAYPKPLRDIISFHRFNEENIYSDIALEIDNISWPFGESVLFESKKLCNEFLNGEIIDIKFLIEHTTVKVHNLNEIDTMNSSNIFTNTSYSFPSPASDNFDFGGPIDLNKHLIKNGAATFLVRAQGSLMLDSGITDQSTLVVDRSVKPAHNSIIVVNLDGEYICRRLKLKPQMSLSSDNPNVPSIDINEGQEVEVLGVVTSSITKL